MKDMTKTSLPPRGKTSLPPGGKTGFKVKIDRSLCSSCGTCTALAPEIFELDDDLISQVKREPTLKDLPSTEEAAQSCPAEAIRIIKQ